MIQISEIKVEGKYISYENKWEFYLAHISND